MFKMEDDIKKFENGRLLQKNCKWETTSKNLKMKDNFKIFRKGKWKWKNENGRRPEKSLKCKMTYFFENEDDLKSKQ